MQDARMHLDRVTSQAIEEAMVLIRDAARVGARSWKHGASPEELRAVVEFLLRPASEQIRRLAVCGASKVEPSPAEVARLNLEGSA